MRTGLLGPNAAVDQSKVKGGGGGRMSASLQDFIVFLFFFILNIIYFLGLLEKTRAQLHIYDRSSAPT